MLHAAALDPGQVIGEERLDPFLVLGIVTPLDFRHYLAALPLLALAVGAASGWLSASHAAGRVVVAAGALWLAAVSLTRALAFLD